MGRRVFGQSEIGTAIPILVSCAMTHESANEPKQSGGSSDLCPHRACSFDKNPHFDSPAQSMCYFSVFHRF